MKWLLPILFFMLFLNLKAQIYTTPKKFEYQVKYTGRRQVSLSTIYLKSLGGSYSIPQGVVIKDYYPIMWSYRDNHSIVDFDYTSIKENSEQIFVHPPRGHIYGTLEFCPFPLVHFPLEVNKSWVWELENIPDVYYQALLSKSKLKTTVKNRYTVSRKFAWFCRMINKHIECFEIIAKGETLLGETRLTAYFSPVYGFVYLDYFTLDRDRFIFSLVNHSSEPIKSRWN